MMLAVIALGAFAATFLGGAVALRYQDQSHGLLGFSAGAVLGVALLDLANESLAASAPYYARETILLTIGAGFLAYLALDLLVSPHSHDHDASDARRGIFGASTLSLHSFLDGLAIGIAFQVSAAFGIVVALAVLVHDFSDGVNTVFLIVKSGGSTRQAFKWLLTDALAPVLGVAATFFFTIPPSLVGLVLAPFAGFFLYISASHLIPEIHHRHSRAVAFLMAIVGFSLIGLVVHLAS